MWHSALARVGGLFIASLGVTVYLVGVGAVDTTTHVVGCAAFAVGLLMYYGIIDFPSEAASGRD